MNDFMELNGKKYDTVQGNAERFGISVMTFHRWRRRYGFAPSLKIGNTNFYDREQIDALVGVKI